ncbi:hypothetical protein PRIPAC_77033 [Pristionchus pacificus]|uniref:Uncharacterized protein n=1 Tax=Pristionchus pacificus TaxID=54126 RepID=A0A2A6CP19_PRIPA|nr:hypothetical protein PRIPAC_77033 [Pristionchus pacificus]|eukprot:PDM79965.1 hypothetical protein PRIPAC_32544 [Pristionchus pacificus]
MMMRRRIDVLCVQEIRWKGDESRWANGYQLVCTEGDGLKNGVAVILSPRWSGCLVEVERANTRLMRVRLDVDGEMITIISAYAPQIGLDKRTKNEFYAKVGEMMENVKVDEMLMIGGDWNGHVGKTAEIFGDGMCTVF